MKRNIFFVFFFNIFAITLLITSNCFSADNKETAIYDPKDPYEKLPCKELIFQPGYFPSSHAPSLVELPNGDLFAVWYSPTPLMPRSLIWGSRKPAGAANWTRPSMIQSTPLKSAKNPVLYFSGDNRLFLFWGDEWRWHKIVKDNLSFKVSADLGHTWSEPKSIKRYSGFLPRTHPIGLKDGRIILPVYCDWTTTAAVATSKDGGLTWEPPRYILPFFGIQPTIIQRSDLSLFALMRSGMPPRLAWQAVSTDMGRSWKGQRFSNVNNPGTSLEMIKLKNGHVVLVFNDSKKDRSSLSIALSYDEGKTWAHTKVIDNKDGSLYVYPSVIQDRNGLIHVLYAYDCRTSIAHFVTDEKWIEE